MLEVGQIMDPKTKELDIAWNQAHFGAWCVVSSPLTLGLNLRSPELPKIIPFITNKEALVVWPRGRIDGRNKIACRTAAQ